MSSRWRTHPGSQRHREQERSAHGCAACEPALARQSRPQRQNDEQRSGDHRVDAGLVEGRRHRYECQQRAMLPPAASAVAGPRWPPRGSIGIERRRRGDPGEHGQHRDRRSRHQPQRAPQRPQQAQRLAAVVLRRSRRGRSAGSRCAASRTTMSCRRKYTWVTSRPREPRPPLRRVDASRRPPTERAASPHRRLRPRMCAARRVPRRAQAGRTAAATTAMNTACSGWVSAGQHVREPATAQRRRTSTIATPHMPVSGSGCPSHCIDTVTSGAAASTTVRVRAAGSRTCARRGPRPPPMPRRAPTRCSRAYSWAAVCPLNAASDVSDTFVSR